MQSGFWGKLRKPFFVLAPMMDITDSPFRRIVAECGKPDVFYTWFVSVDGICSSGKNNILSSPNLSFGKKEKSIVVQLFGRDPKKFFEAAKIMARLGFDGIDINMGCPDKDVLKQGAGASLIKNPELARKIIQAAKKGAGSVNRRIPVSVKTRIGYYKSSELEDWISQLLQEKPAAICVHGRTVKQKYGGEIGWNSIGEAVKLAKGSGTLIIGNGDVKNVEDGKGKAAMSGVQGIMIGREILNNPWLFSEKKEIISGLARLPPPIRSLWRDNGLFRNRASEKANCHSQTRKSYVSKEEKLEMLLKHARLFEKYYSEKKNFGNFRKYIKCYASGFQGSKELRMKLMEAKSVEEIRKIIT